MKFRLILDILQYKKSPNFLFTTQKQALVYCFPLYFIKFNVYKYNKRNYTGSAVLIIPVVKEKLRLAEVRTALPV